ncbi:putative terminase large subunit [uncultured virus]|uniref:Putative terminase large subunit n=1 Tax=uncultured virus TaxID=340016 RepID=A0A218MM45_9VIRU|nr:putative terminase large subunit [uncultured virus]
MIDISRKDILSDSLMQFPDERFIKLPIEGYLDLLGIEPNSSQTGIINGLNNPKYRFMCAAVSRRQGKTYIANILGQLVSLVPNSHILLMSPNYSLSQISFDLQRQLIKHFDLEVIRDNAKDKVIELSNNSTIRMGSVNQVDSVVGRSYDLIIFDEAALVDGRDAFNIALRPTLDKENSKALFISTPRGRNNWFAEFFYRGFSDEFPEWASLRATYHENPRLSESDIAEAQKTMSEAEFNQEYMADFNVFEGQIWAFDHEKCIEDLSELELKRMDIFAGMDVGYRDPTAFVVIAYDWDTQKYFVLDEYLDSERTTEQHATEISKLIEKWNIDYIYIDSAAQQTRFDFAQNYGISTLNAKKSVLDGIGHVAAIVDNDKLIVEGKCNETLWALDQYQWDPNPNLLREKPKHNAASHMSDALRYALYSFETSMTSF